MDGADVRAGTEGSARACYGDAADSRVSHGFVDGGAEVLGEVATDGVEAVGPVEGDQGNPGVELLQDHFWHGFLLRSADGGTPAVGGPCTVATLAELVLVG